MPDDMEPADREPDESRPTIETGPPDDTDWFWPVPPPPAPPVQWSPGGGGRPHRRGRALGAAVVAGFVLLASGIGIGWGLTRNGTSTTLPQAGGTTLPLSPSTGNQDRGLNVQALADKIDPAVVDINTVIGGTVGGNPFGGLPQGHAAGTGMILTPNGEVLTNNHVIQGATSIKVNIPGRSGSYTARVLGADPVDDVALLQIEGVSGLPTIGVADSSSIAVGQGVVAIGNAGGQGGTPTVTVGAITATGRDITVGNDLGSLEHLHGLFQTDASISQGDSGGPLVNSSGQVIAMITASARTNSSQNSSNIGFAIPSDTALRIVNKIRAGHGSPSIIIGQPGFLGVEVRSLDQQSASQLGLSISSGALVVQVVPGTPAAGAGITSGSVITVVNGTRITSADALGPVLHVHKPGAQVRVTWVNAGGTHTATVSLTTGPAV